MTTKRQREGSSRMVYTNLNNRIYGVMAILLKEGNMSKHDIMLIIFKCFVYKMYLIVLLPNLKLTYNNID